MSSQTKLCAENLIANRDLLQLLQEVIQMTPSTAAASGVTQRILSEGAVLALNLFISGALMHSKRFQISCIWPEQKLFVDLQLFCDSMEMSFDGHRGCWCFKDRHCERIAYGGGQGCCRLIIHAHEHLGVTISTSQSADDAAVDLHDDPKQNRDVCSCSLFQGDSRAMAGACRCLTSIIAAFSGERQQLDEQQQQQPDIICSILAHPSFPIGFTACLKLGCLRDASYRIRFVIPEPFCPLLPSLQLCRRLPSEALCWLLLTQVHILIGV